MVLKYGGHCVFYVPVRFTIVHNCAYNTTISGNVNLIESVLLFSRGDASPAESAREFPVLFFAETLC